MTHADARVASTPLMFSKNHKSVGCQVEIKYDSKARYLISHDEIPGEYSLSVEAEKMGVTKMREIEVETESFYALLYLDDVTRQCVR